MDIFIIRHGQSEADILNVHEGRADFFLTELGKSQASRMAQWVAEKYSVEKLYSSPLKRAAQTAEFLKIRINIPIIFDEDLMEFQNGLIAGLSKEEAKAKYPEPSFRYPHTAVYGQESLIDFRMRAERAFSKIVNENDEESTIAVVSHGGMINRLFECFLRMPVVSQIGISTGDTGIHHWRITKEQRRVVFANSKEHLN